MSDDKRTAKIAPNFGVWIGIGVAIGMVLGTALDNLMLGFTMGAGLGYVMALATGQRQTDDIDS